MCTNQPFFRSGRSCSGLNSDSYDDKTNKSKVSIEQVRFGSVIFTSCPAIRKTAIMYVSENMGSHGFLHIDRLPNSRENGLPGKVIIYSTLT